MSNTETVILTMTFIIAAVLTLLSWKTSSISDRSSWASNIVFNEGITSSSIIWGRGLAGGLAGGFFAAGAAFGADFTSFVSASFSAVAKDRHWNYSVN